MKTKTEFKVGKVALLGRPNSGKSTLLNNLIGQKVAVVSDKPQTTQSRITAVYQDLRGQIFFRDTPGLFQSSLRRQNSISIIKESISDANIIVYVADHTRHWGSEEADILKLVLKSLKPFILLFNKIDRPKPSYKDQYLSQMVKKPLAVIEVSALKNKNLHALLDTLFSNLPNGKRDELVDEYVSPLLSQNSTEYLEELIREKIFLLTRQEVPYQATPHVTLVETNKEETRLKVKGTIEVTEDKYKGFLIGKNGSKIQEICEAVKKELELLSNKKVTVVLKVTV